MVNQSVSYSSTDNFLITYSGSDWLIFCCENSIHYKKKHVLHVSHCTLKVCICIINRLLYFSGAWSPALLFGLRSLGFASAHDIPAKLKIP